MDTAIDIMVFIGTLILKALKFVGWVVLALIILPAVFIAGNIYPWWLKVYDLD